MVCRHPVKFECEALSGDGDPINNIGGVSVNVVGPAPVSDVTFQLDSPNFVVNFVSPTLGGEFHVEIKQHGKHIARSPFTLNPGNPNQRAQTSSFPVAFEADAKLRMSYLSLSLSLSLSLCARLLVEC